jgi:hypothetical protein
VDWLMQNTVAARVVAYLLEYLEIDRVPGRQATRVRLRSLMAFTRKGLLSIELDWSGPTGQPSPPLVHGRVLSRHWLTRDDKVRMWYESFSIPTQRLQRTCYEIGEGGDSTSMVLTSLNLVPKRGFASCTEDAWIVVETIKRYYVRR